MPRFILCLVTVDFDKLGLTDNENPYGVLPPVLARSVGRMSGMLLADYIGQVLERRRHSRASPLPRQPPHANFHGGERYYLVLTSLSLLEEKLLQYLGKRIQYQIK
jgi:hypothetical protein